jgi:hypothetical protein
MTKVSVYDTLFLFLFRCEKCHKPITAWSRTPKPGTLEEAEKHVLPLHCVKESGWSNAKMESEALESWAVPWRTKLNYEMAANLQKIGEPGRPIQCLIQATSLCGLSTAVRLPTRCKRLAVIVLVGA